ncbi:hypothetical protein BC937DRAFT_92686 [Endogone sp. FLAS-F59071]|nr:hypothetical protein BC937DRAFT_92686 [Endogone sp. FLAS-F59071]|eukprot:RUS21434.1 hypothetical protein BC937DRAFT_92686 [Endogone sp. FLAS-F59071]
MLKTVKRTLLWAVLVTCLVASTVADQYSFQIFSPQQGAAWYMLGTYNITWNTGILALQNYNLSIHLVTVFANPTAQLTDYVIATDVPYTDGKFLWQVSSQIQTPQNYTLQLYDVTDTAVGLSPSFTIFPTSPTILGTTTPTSVAPTTVSWYPSLAKTITLTELGDSITIVTFLGTGPSPAEATEVGSGTKSGAERIVGGIRWEWIMTVVVVAVGQALWRMG